MAWHSAIVRLDPHAGETTTRIDLLVEASKGLASLLQSKGHIHLRLIPQLSLSLMLDIGIMGARP
jgi:hypothetical protein